MILWHHDNLIQWLCEAKKNNWRAFSHLEPINKTDLNIKRAMVGASTFTCQVEISSEFISIKYFFLCFSDISLTLLLNHKCFFFVLFYSFLNEHHFIACNISSSSIFYLRCCYCLIRRRSCVYIRLTICRHYWKFK